MLSCFILFTGCTDQKGNDDQESNVNSGVEVDINDETNSTEEPASSAPPPDDFTYNPKSPENSDGIVVRPKE